MDPAMAKRSARQGWLWMALELVADPKWAPDRRVWPDFAYAGA